jgi:hypothetical protein
MTRQQYEKQYKQWEQRAGDGVCSWTFACAQIALLSIEYGKWLRDRDVENEELELEPPH